MAKWLVEIDGYNRAEYVAEYIDKKGRRMITVRWSNHVWAGRVLEYSFPAERCKLIKPTSAWKRWLKKKLKKLFR